MSFNFVFDRHNDSRPYPNLAPMMNNPHDTYHGMGDAHPWIAPCRLLLYCADHGYPCTVSYMDQPIPPNAFYPVGLAFFSYDVDYFAMMPLTTLEIIKQGQLTILFYYHEGDNPYREQIRLNELCQLYNLPTNCYRFISGNTEADKIDNFIYFPDHELFYWRNGVVWNGNPMPGVEAHTNIRSKKFTLLNRIHKWWRATITSYIHREGLLDSGYWSYGDTDIGDLYTNNPIMLSRFPGLNDYMAEFLSNSPYRCDDLSAAEHNSHWILADYLYSDSYCSFIMETLYDAEQSGGAFLTEKIFKAIRNGHPFVIFGCPNSLTTLRRLGYRTFDQYIDNSYDSEQNNTERFIKTISTVQQLLNQDLHNWYLNCLEDIRYNQELFIGSKYNRLAALAEALNVEYH